MGISVTPLSRILNLHEQGLLPPGASIMELGAQQLYCRGKQAFLRTFIAKMAASNPAVNPAPFSDSELRALADGGFMSTLVKACGMQYAAIDIFEGDGTLVFDLNRQEPAADMLNRYDLVTNFGTTEHVINQYLSLKTIQEITRPGGLIYHQLPLSGYYTHGYFSYTPLLFSELAQANQYDVVLEAYSKGLRADSPDFMVKNGYPDHECYDFGIEFILRKTIDAPFRVPLETSTSLSVSQDFLADAAARGGTGPAPNSSLRYGGIVTDSRSLTKCSGWELQRELLRRYKHRIARFFGG
ncbi:MAG: methyltransferase domain-containing protein [Bryobacteraceae bacterium]